MRTAYFIRILIALITMLWIHTTIAETPTTPASLQNQALLFTIEKTELVSGNFPHTVSDGQFSYYFIGNKLMADGRLYNGQFWATDFTYAAKDNKGTITQILKWQNGNIQFSATVVTELIYTSAAAGNFSLDFTMTSDPANPVHFIHTGKFKTTDKPLDMFDQSLTYSNLDLIFEEVSNNQPGFDIKQGTKVQYSFQNPQRAAITLNAIKDESKDYKLESIDGFNKRITGTLANGMAYEIKLSFEQFFMGKFEAEVNKGAFKGKGNFMLSRWLPIKDYTIKGTFTDGLKIKSNNTGIEYLYSVYLPPNYQKSNKKYPVIYLTDGQWVKDYHRAVEANHKEFIAVAIEQGPENRRFTDYQLPGATAYIRFLKEELIPQIESQYRTSDKRFYWGASLGGTLGELLLAEETNAKPYFNSYIMADGAYWANKPDIHDKVKTALAEKKTSKISILLSGSRQGNYSPNLNFFKLLQALKNPSLRIKNTELTVTHNEMGPPTFEAYISEADK